MFTVVHVVEGKHNSSMLSSLSQTRLSVVNQDVRLHRIKRSVVAARHPFSFPMPYVCRVFVDNIAQWETVPCHRTCWSTWNRCLIWHPVVTRQQVFDWKHLLLPMNISGLNNMKHLVETPIESALNRWYTF